MPIPARVAQWNKVGLNRVVRHIAPWLPGLGVVVHRGRRSGRTYVTPVGARRVGDMVLIPLTFGNQSDWSRNVRAAGGCTVRLGGHTYRATSPELVTWADDRALIASAFNPVLRAGFRLLGIRQFMRLHAVLTG